MTKSGKIADKDRYEELTDTQAAIVDAIVEDPDRIQSEVAERAEELLQDRGHSEPSVNRSYVSDIKNTYDNIIQFERSWREGYADRPDNAPVRVQGGNSTDNDNGNGDGQGDPFQGQLDPADGWQGIKDRPARAGGMTASPYDNANDQQQPQSDPEPDAEPKAKPEPEPEPEQQPKPQPEQAPVPPRTVQAAMGTHGSILVELDIDAVEEIVLNGSLPDSLRRQVFDAVVRQAFPED